MNHYWIKTEIARLAIMPRPGGGDWLSDDIGFLKRSGVQAIVSALTESEAEELLLSQEETCCAQHGLRFYSFPIEHRSVPQKASEFREFLDRLDAELRKGAVLAIRLVMRLSCPNASFDSRKRALPAAGQAGEVRRKRGNCRRRKHASVNGSAGLLQKARRQSLGRTRKR